MKLELSGCCFRIAFELFWPRRAPVYRPYRIAGHEGEVRRKLLRAARKRLKNHPQP